MADGFRVKRIKAELPALKIPKRVMDDVGRVVEGSILENIRTQRQASGAALKSNAPSTIERKRRLGRPNLSLVDELHRFVQGSQRSWKWSATTQRKRAAVVVEPASAELRKLVRYVQQKGYVGWFEMSKRGEAAVRKIFRDWIKADFAKAAAKSRAKTKAR